MRRSRNRLIQLVLGILCFYVAVAVLYHEGMMRLEHRPRTFLQSLEWASETISTTGYGSDNHWDHPLMLVLVIGVQFVGIILVPLIITLYLIPFLSERFEERVPRAASDVLNNHVVVYAFSPTVETLLQRLADQNVQTLVVETDESRARAVMERRQAVVFSRSDEDALDICRLGNARALVANGSDQENAALILRARQMGFMREIFAFVEDPSHRKPMELAGATAVYTPRHIVAAALAAHASDVLSPRLPGLEQIDGVERRELRVAPGSAIAAKTLRDAHLPAAVVGVWSRSRLTSHCTPDTLLEPGSVLELVGTPDALAESAAIAGVPLMRASGPFLIAGFGEVGRKVHELLCDAGEEVRVIERSAGPDVDVVGDVLDSSVLERAHVTAARALILALDSDDSTLFATVIARDLAADVPIIARVNHARNLDNIHRAGADYALSIADISGQMLSSRLLGKHARVREEHRRIVRVQGPPQSSTAILAVERGGETIRRIPADFRIDPTDGVWICTV